MIIIIIIIHYWEICLFVFQFYSKFRKNKLIEKKKIEYVVRLHKFSLSIKNCHCFVHTFFTEKRQKFNMLSFTFSSKCAKSLRNLDCFFKVRDITSCSKKIFVPYIDFTRIHQKSKSIIISFFNKTFCSIMKFGYLSKLRKITLYILNIVIVSYMDFYRAVTKIRRHYDLWFPESVPNCNKIWIFI